MSNLFSTNNFSIMFPESVLWALAVPVCMCFYLYECVTAALPISVSHRSVLSQHTHTSALPPVIVLKAWGFFFPRHKDKERKSESRCMWQYQGEWVLRCLGDSVVIGTKQIKCQPLKRWLGSRGSGQANSFGKQSTAILFSPSAAVLTFLLDNTDGHFGKRYLYQGQRSVYQQDNTINYMLKGRFTQKRKKKKTFSHLPLVLSSSI